MKQLVIRYSVMLTLLLFFLGCTYVQGKSPSMALFVSTVLLAFYFIVPHLKKLHLWGYMSIFITLYIPIIFSIEAIYMMPLMVFLFTESAFLLSRKELLILSSVIMSIVTFFVCLTWMPVVMFVVHLIFIGSITYLHSYYEKASTIQTLYEALLSEYRSLKRLVVQQEEHVRIDERTKIARDIHDAVGHNLTVLLMQLEMLSMRFRTDELEDVKQLARQSLEDTRYAVRRLKESETYGISSVIHLIRKLEMESRLHIRFTMAQGVLSMPMSNKQNIVLYRVLQECLTNAMKHSDSKMVQIVMERNSLGQLHVQVSNKTFCVEPIVYGFGLNNMQERVTEIGGTVMIRKVEEQFIVSMTF